MRTSFRWSGHLLCIRTAIELIDQLLASGFGVVTRVIQPSMIAELLRSGPIVTIVREKLEDEVFEGVTEIVSVNFVPVCVKAAVENQSIEILLLACLFEWEDALHDYKKNHSK